jgi:sugar lactone lactonase YvrE
MGEMTLTELANGFCFGVSPRWFEGLLWFSDMVGETVHTVDLKGSMTALPLSGHRPFGLGFRPDGSLLIASTETRQLLCYDGDETFIQAYTPTRRNRSDVSPDSPCTRPHQ